MVNELAVACRGNVEPGVEAGDNDAGSGAGEMGSDLQTFGGLWDDFSVMLNISSWGPERSLSIENFSREIKQSFSKKGKTV